MAWPFRSRRGRHRSAELEPTVTPVGTPAHRLAVGLVFVDGSSIEWTVDEPHARPFIAIADSLLASSGSPVWPMTPP
jgi:hypothetical protein